MNVPELFWNAIKGLDHYGALIAALATIAIAGFTWTLKKSTDKLWDASEKQTALSRHALISTEQAFVFCKQMHAVAGVDGKNGKVDEWMFMPVWENSGSTRTKRLFMDSS